MADAPRLVLADDEPNLRRVLGAMLSQAGYEVLEAKDGLEAAELLGPGVAALITDLKMPRLDGMGLLRRAAAEHPDIPVIVLTAHGSVDSAVEAVKLGAFDYIEKPFEQSHLWQVVEKAVRTHAFGMTSQRAIEPRSGAGRHGLIGGAPNLEQVFQAIDKVADTPSTVLISGESGTGKELVARAIHFGGERAKGPFKPINCAALPREIIESELFGHVRGAFTNAHEEHQGLFRAADGGTLFLDEVAEMPSETQAKLLRAIEEGKVRPVGSTSEVAVDCRIIAATNHEPAASVKRGELREDLFYRLAVISIELPPLRDRTDDIPLLVQHFVAQFNERFGKRIRGFEPAAVEALMKYAWPGNIRELRNVVEGIFAMAKGSEITLADLPPKIVPRVGGGGDLAAIDDEGSVPPLEETLREVERKLILRALRLARGNKSHAADLLRVSRKRIYRKLEEYGIPVDEALRDEA